MHNGKKPQKVMAKDGACFQSDVSELRNGKLCGRKMSGVKRCSRKEMITDLMDFQETYSTIKNEREIHKDWTQDWGYFLGSHNKCSSKKKAVGFLQ